ncbi:putative disease resistance RPP8-like protein 2 [Camellia lanceoleosa]|uniref:Disease resistance RPP8-like protein 2 n=1 Tax=Camellia lanceoleosa TaxID=1840588 RepID=A0ACC0GSN9_9ERIC|nr:putative disease resistance RPP8-like protein 2 [Camellia lanceoleosa]
METLVANLVERGGVVLFQVFVRELKLLKGIVGQVDRFEKDLRLIQSLLEDVEAKEEPGEDGKQWADKAGEIFQEVEDIIDIFLSKSARYRRRGTFKRKVIRGMERTGDEFRRLYGILINDFKFAEDERTKAWVKEIKDASDLAQHVFESIIEKRNKQLRKGRIFKVPLLFLKDLELKKDMKRIDVTIQRLYDRKWRYGIGHFGGEPQNPASVVPSRWRRFISVAVNVSLIFHLNISVLVHLILFTVAKIGIRRLRKAASWLRVKVDDELESIKRDLVLKQAFLEDIGPMEDLDKRVGVWLKEMIEIFDCDATDLEKYIDIAKAEQEKMTGIFRRPCLTSRKVIGRLKIAKKIIRISNKLLDLSRRKWTYDIGNFEARRDSYAENPSQQQHVLTTSDDAVENHNIRSSRRPSKKLEEKVESIRNELKLMSALFEDVESMENQDKRLMVWVEEMKDVAGDAQKFSNSCAENIEQKRIDAFRRCCFAKFVVPREVNRIKHRIHELSKRKWTYDVRGIKGRKGQSSVVEIQPESSEITATSNITNLEGAQPVSLHAREERGHSINGVIFRSILQHILQLIHLQAADSVEENVESIKRDKSLMDALFEDVGGIEIQDRRLKAWIKEMKDVRRDAQDAINKYNEITRGNCWRFKKRLMAKKIKFIMSTIQDASERRLKYGVEHIKRREELATITRSPHHTPPFIIEQPNVTGFFDDVQAVLAQLLTNDKNCCIIPIVGMEGIGKTILARLIYNNNAVSDHFPHRAWVSASSYCNIEALLKGIEEQVLMGIQEQNRKPIVVSDLKEKVLMGLREQKGKQFVEEPIQMLYEVLTSARYLIVLDDVRTTEVWDRLLKEFPSTLHGSRIILTTRDIGVATHANPISVPHKLQLLSDDDSWALFSQTLTIPDGQLEQGKKDIIRCGGLPWAIVELRKQFLGVESSFNAWSSVRNNLKNDQKPWLKTLEAFKVLPSYLKRCLSYLRRFPAGFEIPLRRLIVLWIAEGVVYQRRGDEDPPESVGERYLTELIDRNMVQVTKRKLNGAVQKCRLPHALRELWSLEAKKAVSPKSYTRKGSKISPETYKIHHLAHSSDQTDVSFDHTDGEITNLSTSLLPGHKHVISFRSFDTREGSQPGEELGRFLDRWISCGYFLSMRVLDLERVFRPELPKSLGELVLLRYLGLRWTYLEDLPSFISELLNLQTLDLKHTSISTLPPSIWKMELLRHLYLDESYRCRFVPQPKGYSLTSLQTLWSVFIDEDSPVKGGMDGLINLKRLGVTSRIMSSRQEAMLSQLEAVADWVQKLTQLQYLRLKSFDKHGQPWFLPLKPLSAHTNVSSIYLLGLIEEKFLVYGLPWALTELTLSASGLKEDPMRTLKNLPNLRILRLFSNSFIGKHMLCSPVGFPQLRVLALWKLEQLEEWKVAKGALPNLIDLEIRSCTKLKMLPDGLRDLRTLQKLKLTDMPKQFTDRITVNQGEDWGKIAHVRHVYIDDVLVDDDEIPVANTSVIISSEIWMELLNSTIHERQKIFLWRLVSAKIQIDSSECPFCGAKPKSAVHLFLCKPIKMIWFAKLGIMIDDFSHLSFSDWINHILTLPLIFGVSPPSKSDFVLFAVILMEKTWLWRNRAISCCPKVEPDTILKETCSAFNDRAKPQLSVNMQGSFCFND